MSEPPEGETELSLECDEDTPCEQTLCETKRRRLLGALAAGSSAALAGCTGLLAAPEEPSVRGQTSQHRLEFLREGRTINARGSRTVLRAGLDADLDLSYRCRAGFCGECLAQADQDARQAVHMSINDVDELNEEAIEAGYFLPCTSQPKTDFAITSNLGEDGAFRGELEEFQEPVDEEEERSHVTYIHDGEPVVIDFDADVDDLIAEDRNLLVAGEEEELDMIYQCRVGECGQCMAKVSGDGSELIEMTNNAYDPLDEEAVEDGWVLTCTGFPNESFTMRTDAIGDFQDRE